MTQDTALKEAQALLKAKRYDEARKLLKKINHPTAEKWLAQLEQIAPLPVAKRSQSRVIPATAAFAVIVIALIAAVLLATSTGTSKGDEGENVQPLPSHTEPTATDSTIMLAPEHGNLSSTEEICDEYCLQATQIVATNAVVISSISATETAIASYLNSQTTPPAGN